MIVSSSLIADVSYKSTLLFQKLLLISQVIFTGDSDVGKTALINRFKNDSFDSNGRPTVGVEFAKRLN